MDLALKGKVALVTGASRGIGKGIAASLSEEGCFLVICARDSEKLAATVAELDNSTGKAVGLALDITGEEAPVQLVQFALKQFGRIDILVNNAGGNRRMPFEKTTDEDWSAILDLNLMAHLRCSRAVIPHMKKAGEGSIVFISSIFGREAGGPGLSIYNATKSALISAAKIMSLELAPFNIRVNSVAPGSIRFPGGSWDRRVVSDPEGMKDFVEAFLPLGRFGTVAEVANLVTFLSSDRASLVTGTCINVDGGQSRSLI